MIAVDTYLLQSLHALRLPLEPQVQPAQLQIHGRHVQRVGGVVYAGGTIATVGDDATQNAMLKLEVQSDNVCHRSELVLQQCHLGSRSSQFS